MLNAPETNAVVARAARLLHNLLELPPDLVAAALRAPLMKAGTRLLVAAAEAAGVLTARMAAAPLASPDLPLLIQRGNDVVPVLHFCVRGLGVCLAPVATAAAAGPPLPLFPPLGRALHRALCTMIEALPRIGDLASPIVAVAPLIGAVLAALPPLAGRILADVAAERIRAFTQSHTPLGPAVPPIAAAAITTITAACGGRPAAPGSVAAARQVAASQAVLRMCVIIHRNSSAEVRPHRHCAWLPALHKLSSVPAAATATAASVAFLQRCSSCICGSLQSQGRSAALRAQPGLIWWVWGTSASFRQSCGCSSDSVPTLVAGSLATPPKLAML